MEEGCSIEAVIQSEEPQTILEGVGADQEVSKNTAKISAAERASLGIHKLVVLATCSVNERADHIESTPARLKDVSSRIFKK